MKLKHKRNGGISLRTTHFILVIGAVIISCLMFYSTFHLSVSFQRLTDASEEQIELRKAAKKEKNFAEADRIRNELLEKGIVLKDTREGTLWEIQ